jgi:hypothetical protein
MVQVHEFVHLHRDSPLDSQYRDSRLTGLLLFDVLGLFMVVTENNGIINRECSRAIILNGD